MKHQYLLDATRSITYKNSRTLDHPYSVIQAVLNLHSPTLNICDTLEGESETFYTCTSCPDTEYPCATIQAIEAELNA